MHEAILRVFHVLCLMVSKLVIVSKNDLQDFSLAPLILKFKKFINEKAKIQTPFWSVKKTIDERAKIQTPFWVVIILLNSNLFMSKEEFL